MSRTNDRNRRRLPRFLSILMENLKPQIVFLAARRRPLRKLTANLPIPEHIFHAQRQTAAQVQTRVHLPSRNSLQNDDEVGRRGRHPVPEV